MQASGIDGGASRVADRAAAEHGADGADAGAHARLEAAALRRRRARRRAGCWAAWQALNRSATIDHCVEQLEAAGNLDNLRRLGEPAAGGFQRPVVRRLRHLQGARGGRLGDRPRRRRGLGRASSTTTAALLREAQDDDGYLNSWIQGVRPERRWQDLEESHELYCLGHLIQARRRAGARRRARRRCSRSPAASPTSPSSGSARRAGSPVSTATRRSRRRSSSSTGTPGDERYLALAASMVELRGRGPARRRSTSGRSTCRTMRRSARPPSRSATPSASSTSPPASPTSTSRTATRRCSRRWRSCGGAPSRRRRTSPARTARATATRRSAIPTSCRPTAPTARPAPRSRASCGTGGCCWPPADGRYADEMERLLYNAIAVSTSVDGCHFFYSNPLHLRTGHDGSDEDAPSERLPWFRCACCPPNLARLVASLHHYVATRDAEGVQLHLLAAGRVESRARRRQAGRARRVDGLPLGRPRRDRRRRPRGRVDAVAAGPGVVRGRDR